MYSGSILTRRITGMRITRKFNHYIATLCAVTTFLAFVAPGSALAKAPKNLGWDNVLKVQSGTSVAVVLFNKQIHQGKIEKAEPTGITLTTKQGSLLLPAGDIESITTIAKPKLANPGAWIMVGGVALATASLFTGTVQDTVSVSNGKIPGNRSYVLPIVGMCVAAGGLAILLLVGKPRLIYKAVAPPPEAGK
jgi:hypothetical protein